MLPPNGSAPWKEIESHDLLATGLDAAQHLGAVIPFAQILAACVLCFSFATLMVFPDQNYSFDSTSTRTRPIFEGRTILLKLFASGGWQHERQQTKETNTGTNAKQEAHRDHEAKSAQSQNHQTIKSRILGQDPG
jgi:hypothetical protein